MKYLFDIMQCVWRYCKLYCSWFDLFASILNHCEISSNRQEVHQYIHCWARGNISLAILASCNSAQLLSLLPQLAKQQKLTYGHRTQLQICTIAIFYSKCLIMITYY